MSECVRGILTPPTTRCSPHSMVSSGGRGFHECSEAPRPAPFLHMRMGILHRVPKRRGSPFVGFFCYMDIGGARSSMVRVEDSKTCARTVALGCVCVRGSPFHSDVRGEPSLKCRSVVAGKGECHSLVGFPQEQQHQRLVATGQVGGCGCPTGEGMWEARTRVEGDRWSRTPLESLRISTPLLWERGSGGWERRGPGEFATTNSKTTTT